MAIIPQPPSNPQAAITPSQATHRLRTGEWTDDAVLQIVNQDAIKAENFELNKNWVSAWASASTLYQSPFFPNYWRGTQLNSASVPFFTVALIVNSLTPQISQGIFYEDPPFDFQKRPGTTMQAARAVTAVISYQLENMEFRKEFERGLENALLFGTNIWKWGWEITSRKRTIYTRAHPLTAIAGKNGLPDIKIEPLDTDIEVEEIEEYIDRPFFETKRNLRHVLVDPGLNTPDIRDAKYVIDRQYLTWEDLDKLRDRPGYKIPSRDELLAFFMPPKEPIAMAPGEQTPQSPLWDLRATPRYDNNNTIDPFKEPLEVLEYWNDTHVFAVLQRKLVICNEANPYGCIPFLSVNWWNVPEAFYGMGLAKIIGSEQRLQQSVTNNWLDILALNLGGVWLQKRGQNVPSQNISMSPGRIIPVDDTKDGFVPLGRLPQVPEAMEAVSMSMSRAEQISGANELVTQGNLPVGGGRSSITRTATGANILAGGSSSRMQQFIERVAGQVFIPFLSKMHELNCALLPLSTLKYILSDELQHEYLSEGGADGTGGDLVELLNAKLKFSIKAASLLQAKRQMAQALPILAQMLEGPYIQQALGIEGKKVNVEELIRMFFQTSGWPNYNDVIQPMSQQEQERFMAISSGQNKLAAQSALQQQKFEQNQQLLDQENMSRAGRDVLRTAFKDSTEPEVISGAPTGTQGFGST